MLKITVEKNSRCTTLRVEGRLAGPWVDELERAWRAANSESPDGALSVDLNDVTFVGEEGKQLLESMYGQGVKLKASGCVTSRLVEEIGRSVNQTYPRHGVPNPE